MKAIYENGRKSLEVELSDFYEEVAKKLAEEDLSYCPQTVKVTVPGLGAVIYQISLRSGTRFITELDNSLPSSLETDIHPCFLTCVDPKKNAYKFYKLQPQGDNVIAEYGRMGTQKGDLFSARTFTYPIRMYWIKYQEKLSKGYVDRTAFYMPDEEAPEEKAPLKNQGNPTTPSAILFDKLKRLAKIAVERAAIKVPVTTAIINESKRLLSKMYEANDVDEFNAYLMELISVLQRPVRTGDGTGVRRLMANTSNDFSGIISRESDLIQAMEGSITGSGMTGKAEDFDGHNIEVYEATERQKEQVLSHLSDDLKKKVKKVYRVIPRYQQDRFNQYLKSHKVRKVKQLWHGSRNENWMSIILNNLLLNPDARITGKMYGNGICVKRSIITCI